MGQLARVLLLCICMGTAVPLQAIEVVQTTPGFTVGENAAGDASASAFVLPGVGNAKLWVSASTVSAEAASAEAARSMFGVGVVRSRLGGVGDPQILRATVRLEALLSYSLAASPLQDSPAGCCGFEATLDLTLHGEREDAELGFVGARDFEIDIVDHRVGRVGADGATAVDRNLTFGVIGDVFTAPSFEDAYLNGRPMLFSFLLPEGGAFRLGVDFQISVKAFASQPNPVCGPPFGLGGVSEFYPASAAVTFDASNSLYWGGLELVDAVGNPLPFDYLPVSGLDLGQSYVPSIPEPTTGLLLLVGLSTIRFAKQLRWLPGAVTRA